jgi:hypothetical protein
MSVLADKPATSDRVLSAAQRACGKVAYLTNRYRYLLLALVSLIYFTTTIYRASRLLFWFDEIFTIYEANLPDLRSLWHALIAGVDGELPLLHLLTRWSEHLLGVGPLGVRMPEIIAFWVFCLCLFRFVAVRTNAFGGLISMVFPMVTEAYWYSYDARAHALALCASGVALMCWQAAAEKKHARFVPLFGVQLSLVAALLLHPYSVLIFVPLVAGEIARVIVRHRPDWVMWFAIATPAPIGLIYLPVLQGSKNFHNLFPPSLDVLFTSYSVLFTSSITILVIALTLIYASELARPLKTSETTDLSNSSRGRLPVHETVALNAAVVLPFFMFAIARAAESLMLPRYALPCVFGISALLGIGLARRPVIGVIVLVLISVLFGYKFRQYRSGAFLTEPMVYAQLSTSRRNFDERYELFRTASAENLPIVLLDSADVTTTFYYAPADVLPRLVYLHGQDWEANAFLYKTLIDCCGAPGKVMKWPEFLREHRRFLAFGFGIGGFALRSASVKALGFSDGKWLLLVDCAQIERGRDG